MIEQLARQMNRGEWTSTINKRYPGEIPTLDTRAESNELVPRELRYKQILEVMSDFNRPMTAKEIAHNMNMRGYIPTSERNFTAPRLTELCKSGKVEPCGKATCQWTKKTVTTYRIREVS